MRARRTPAWCAVLIFTVFAACNEALDLAAAPKRPKVSPLVGRDPIEVIAAADARVVLIGEHHGWSEQHEFLRDLVSDPVIHRRFDDIVVEFGNARFQPVVDAYVEGQKVPLSLLSSASSETTQGPSAWQSSDYTRFFTAVRRSNNRYPKGQQLRVLLGDPPVDMSKIAGARELDLWVLQRGAHFAYAIQRHVVSRGRRALVIAGVAHVVRRPAPFPTLTNRLEGTVRCSPDPLAVARGINWCDDLRRFKPIDSLVIVPYSSSFISPERQETLDGFEEPTIVQVEGSWLAELPLVDVLGDSTDEDGSGWHATDGFDGLLVGL